MVPTSTDRDASGLLWKVVDGSQDNKCRMKGDAPIAFLFAGRNLVQTPSPGPPISRGKRVSSISGIAKY